MKIQFAWEINHRHTALALAGSIGAQVGIPLLPEMDSRKNIQFLTFEAPGISGQIKPGMKGTGYYIRDIQASLLNWSVTAKLFINGMPVDDYAALQESRLEYLQFHAQKAIDELRATRSWLKDKRFAEIRRRLEIALDNSKTKGI